MNSLLAFMLLAGAAAFLSGNSNQHSSSITEAIEDLRLLSQLSDDVMPERDRSIVIGVHLEGEKAELEAFAAKYNAADHIFGSLKENNGKWSLRLQYRTSGAEALSSAVSWMESTSTDMERVGVSGDWNISIEGWMTEGQEISDLLGPLLLYISAYEVESVQEGQLFYVSYYSGLFHRSISVGDEEMNLQIAAGYSSETEQWRMSFGTPKVISFPLFYGLDAHLDSIEEAAPVVDVLTCS